MPVSPRIRKRPDLRQVTLRLVRDEAHVSEVLETAVLAACSSIWIATANLKDVHIEAPLGSSARARGRYESLFERLRLLASRGVEIRILHAASPSRALRDRTSGKRSLNLVFRQCPRVHQKIVAVDGSFLYIGSANLTGAGLGAKGQSRRNFELGVVTDDDVLLDEVQSNFDAIWSGKHCKTCKLRTRCPKPLDGGLEKPSKKRLE